MNEDFKKTVDSLIKTYMKNGVSKPQAISLVCKKYNFNPTKLIMDYYPEIKNDGDSYKDIKTEVGSFVTLKGKSPTQQYEVININNKDAIVLRNVEDNNELTASESEIIPVVMENNMKNKLKEAQYNISISDLSTTDADTLSQMLSLASQAEGSSDDLFSMGSDLDTPSFSGDLDPSLDNSMGDDFGSSLGDESIGSDMDTSLDIPETDDISFDEELETDDNMVDPLGEMDFASDDSLDEPVNVDPFGDDSYEDEMDADMFESFGDEHGISDDEVNEDVLLSKNEKDPTEVAKEKLGEEDIDSMIEEALKNAGVDFSKKLNEEEDLNEVEENIPGEELISEEDNSINGDYQEAMESLDAYCGDMGRCDDEMILSFCQDLAGEYGLNANKLYNMYMAEIGKNGSSIKETDDNIDSIIEEELKNILQNAGIIYESETEESEEELLDEADLPTLVSQKSTFANKPNKLVKGDNASKQEPKYTEIDTTPFGKDSSEGFKKSMTMESTIKMGKIKSIYETAKSMYATKDSNDWNLLDRRYITKLIKEGVGYNKASKMLLNAKKGK